MTRQIQDDYRDDPLMPALRARHRMEEIQCYLEAGRRFSDLPRDELDWCYAACVRLVLAEGIDRPGLDEALADLGAELALRRLPEPLHLIESWLPVIDERMEKAARDPRVQAEIRRMLGGLAQEMARPKH